MHCVRCQDVSENMFESLMLKPITPTDMLAAIETVKSPAKRKYNPKRAYDRAKLQKWVFGLTKNYSKGSARGQTAISADTKRLPRLATLIGRYAQQCGIEHTSVQVTCCHPAGIPGLHIDKADFSAQHFTTLGNFTGGESWQHKHALDARGSIIEVPPGKMIMINGHIPHTVCPYEGVRWGLAYYDAAVCEQLDPAILASLTKLHFQPPKLASAVAIARRAGVHCTVTEVGVPMSRLPPDDANFALQAAKRAYLAAYPLPAKAKAPGKRKHFCPACKCPDCQSVRAKT